MTKIEELREAYENATPGEWEVEQGPISVVIGPKGQPIARLTGWPDSPDARFITLAHNMMPQLLEAVEKVQELTSWLHLRHMGEASDEDVDETIEEAKAFLAKLEGV